MSRTNCFICGKPTNSVAGNPLEWPIWLGYPGGNGKTRCYCTGCVIEKVNAPQDSMWTVSSGATSPERSSK